MVEDWAENGELERFVVFSTNDEVPGQPLFEVLD